MDESYSDSHALILIIIVIFILVTIYNKKSLIEILVGSIAILIAGTLVVNYNDIENMNPTLLYRAVYSRIPQPKLNPDNIIVETHRYKFGHPLHEMIPTHIKKDNRWPNNKDYNNIMGVFKDDRLTDTQVNESFQDNIPKYFKTPKTSGTLFLKSRKGNYGSTNSTNLTELIKVHKNYDRTCGVPKMDKALNGDLTMEANNILKPRARELSNIQDNFESYPDIIDDPRYDPSGAFELAKKYYYVDENKQPLHSLTPKHDLESSRQPLGKNVENPSSGWQAGNSLAKSAIVEPVNDYTEYNKMPDPNSLVVDTNGKVLTPMPKCNIELDPMLKLLPQNHPTLLAMKHSDAARINHRVYGRDNLNKSLIQDVLSYRQIAKWSTA